MKDFDHEIVSGSIFRSIWKLAWPVTLLNLVNGMPGFTHQILVGQFLHTPNNASNAAIGLAWQVFLVIVVFVASLFHGMNVMIARYSGKRDQESLSRVAYQSFLASVYVLLGVMAPAGYFLAPHMLQGVGASEEVAVLALPYLRILFTCGSPLFLMFMFTGAFQASGDTKVPLVLGTLSAILNIVISSILIMGLGPIPSMGIIGAAMGIVLSSSLSVCIAIALILKGKTVIQPPKRYTLIPDFSILRAIVKIGLPTGVQGVLLNIGGVFVMMYISKLEDSTAALAAYTLCYSQLFSLVSWISFGLRNACGTVMGQNIGAGKPERGKTAVFMGAMLGAVWAVMIGAMFLLIPEALLGMFHALDEPIFSYSVTLLKYLSVSGIALMIALALTGGIQGAGETKLPMYIAFLTQIVVLLGICQYHVSRGTLTPEHIWMAILISHASRLLLTYAVFRTEKWTLTQVELVKETAE